MLNDNRPISGVNLNQASCSASRMSCLPPFLTNSDNITIFLKWLFVEHNFYWFLFAYRIIPNSAFNFLPRIRIHECRLWMRNMKFIVLSLSKIQTYIFFSSFMKSLRVSPLLLLQADCLGVHGFCHLELKAVMSQRSVIV